MLPNTMCSYTNHYATYMSILRNSTIHLCNLSNVLNYTCIIPDVGSSTPYRVFDTWHA